MIEIKNVEKYFHNGEHLHKALHNINLEIANGDIFGIIGKSGAGKSTLIRCLNKLEVPDKGSVIIDGVNLGHCSGKHLADIRKNIAMIFQNFNLFSQLTVIDNVLFPRTVHCKITESDKQKAYELLDLVGIAHKSLYYPSQLSGGQAQRVAIARALINEPQYLLCDEATSALDTETTFQILQLLADINKKFGVTIILITHDMRVIKNICTKVAVIDKGCIVEQGLCSQILAHPSSEITQGLLGVELS